MRLGIRVFFGFFLITGLAAFFILRLFITEIKPSVREVMEDMLVDTAYILAELAVDDIQRADFQNSSFSKHVQHYSQRSVDIKIWGLNKQSLDLRVYVTNAQGRVVFDSEHKALGADFSNWRDVYLTLKGQYGARSTRSIKQDDTSTVMYVAAPIMIEQNIVGVLTVAKPIATIQSFIDRAEKNMLLQGIWLIFASILIGVLVTLWLVWNIRKLKHYTNAVETGVRVELPKVPGELGDLAIAIDTMRQRVAARQYIESYVQALTHELKSPLSVLQGSAELLQEDLPQADAQFFSKQILEQTHKLNTLIGQMLELVKLEKIQALPTLSNISLNALCQTQMSHWQHLAQSHCSIVCEFSHHAPKINLNEALIHLALNNIVQNAIDFTPTKSQIKVTVGTHDITIQDQGLGMPDFILDKVGQRFVSTTRPDGQHKGSGLGLAIAKQIMLLHSGSIDFSNTQTGLCVKLIFNKTNHSHNL